MCKKNKENKENKEDTNNNVSLKKYIHSIRNSKSFDMNTLIQMNNLSYKDRLEILILYNEMMIYYSLIFETD